MITTSNWEKRQQMIEETTAYELYNALKATREHDTGISVKEVAKQIKLAYSEAETNSLINELQK